MLEFEFNGHKSSEYGVIISKVEENDALLSRSPILGQKNKYRARENHFGMNYENNYSFNVTLIKNPCKILHADITNQTTILLKNNVTTTKNILVFNHGSLLPSLEHVEDKNERYFLDFSDDYYKDLDHNIFSLNGTDYFTSNDISKINAWLTSDQFPTTFKFYDDKYFKEDIEYLTTVTSSETENLGQPYSLTFTFTCDSPYGYTAEIVKKFDSNAVDYKTVYNLFNNTDCKNDYIYPIIHIDPYKTGDITIKNNTDSNNILALSNVQKNEPFYIDCNKYEIYSVNSNNEKIVIPFSKFNLNPNIYWPRLCPGNNILEFWGNATISFIYREPRKAGVFA